MYKRKLIQAISTLAMVVAIVTGWLAFPARAAAANLTDTIHTANTATSFVAVDQVHKLAYHQTVIKLESYTIKSGDTLAIIAKRHSMSWQGLYCYNEKKIGSDPNFLTPGTKITLATKNGCKTPTSTPAQNVPYKSGNTTSSVPVVHPSGSLQAYALHLLGGNQVQFSCLNSVINRESGWNVYAQNPSGAYGIPQALPGSKMSVAGSDWATDGYTQLRWMIEDYIPPTYGDPCGAWAHELADGWY